VPFENRWRITGVLTTIVPLHIGDGGVTTRTDLINEKEKDEVEISSVATDHEGRAYLPGKTLKGNLRTWLSTPTDAPSALIESVFGSEDPGSRDAVGGKAEFWDALVDVTPTTAPRVPYWDAKRLAGVAASVAIDRKTRTASHTKLFHEEFVPPGVSFAVTITGQDLTPDELALLLFALEGFNNSETPASLGADTGDQQGRLTWRLRDIARLRKEEVLAWAQRQNPPVAYNGLISLRDDERQALLAQAQTLGRARPRAFITLTLDLHFEGPFLVNDPSKTRKEKDREQSQNEEERTPDHEPLRNHEGRLLLPARSIRGAVRSQAEKIVRTLNPNGACLSVDPEHACPAIYDAPLRATHLCLTCQAFGAPGWRAPVEFSDFLPAQGGEGVPFYQEMLAIDRFTGGSARHFKFNACAVYRPILTGTMTVDLHRIDPWALGLFALALRDLIEGDIPLGFGAAKGYGACRATIRGIRITNLSDIPAEFQAILKNNDALQIDLNSLDTTSKPEDEIALVLMALISAFQSQVASFQKVSEEKGNTNDLS